MKTRYKHIHFIEDFEQLDSEDTLTYICRNNKTDNILGVVAYYLPWKKYEFIGEEGAGFDISCLEDIIDFTKQLSKEATNGKDS